MHQKQVENKHDTSSPSNTATFHKQIAYSHSGARAALLHSYSTVKQPRAMTKMTQREEPKLFQTQSRVQYQGFLYAGVNSSHLKMIQDDLKIWRGHQHCNNRR